MADKRRAPFRTLGMRMQDFGRNLMRHYVPPESAPINRSITPPPMWQSDAQTPLIWNEPSSIPAPVQNEFIADVEPEMPPVESLPFEPPAPPRPSAPRPAAPAQPAPVQRKPAPDEEKIDPRLLAILAAHKEHDDYAAQVREERKAAAAAAEIQRKAEESQPDAPLTRRRNRTSFDYVETKALQPQEGEPGYVPPPKNLPPADVIQPTRSLDEPDDDTEESSPAAVVAPEPASEPPILNTPDVPLTAQPASQTAPVVQRTTEPETPLEPPVSADQPAAFLDEPAEPSESSASEPVVSAPSKAENRPANQPVIQRSTQPRASTPQPPSQTTIQQPNTPTQRETPPASPSIQRQTETEPIPFEPETIASTPALSDAEKPLSEPSPQTSTEPQAPETSPLSSTPIQRQIEPTTTPETTPARPATSAASSTPPVQPTAEIPAAPTTQSLSRSKADETASRQAASSVSADRPAPSIPAAQPVVQRLPIETAPTGLETPLVESAVPDQPATPVSSTDEPFVSAISREIEAEPTTPTTNIEQPLTLAHPAANIEQASAPERPTVQRTAEAPEPAAPPIPLTNAEPDVATDIKNIVQPPVPAQPPAIQRQIESPAIQRAIKPPQLNLPINRAGDEAETEAAPSIDFPSQREALPTPSQPAQPPTVQRQTEPSASATPPVEPVAAPETVSSSEAPAVQRTIEPPAALAASENVTPETAMPTFDTIPSQPQPLQPDDLAEPSSPVRPAKPNTPSATTNLPPALESRPTEIARKSASENVITAPDNPAEIARKPIPESVNTLPALPFEPRETSTTASEPAPANPPAPSVEAPQTAPAVHNQIPANPPAPPTVAQPPAAPAQGRPIEQTSARPTEIARKPISEDAEAALPNIPAIEAPETLPPITAEQPTPPPVASRPVELPTVRPTEIAHKPLLESLESTPDRPAEISPALPFEAPETFSAAAEPLTASPAHRPVEPPTTRPTEIARKPVIGTPTQALPDFSAEPLPFDEPLPPAAPDEPLVSPVSQPAARPTEIARKPETAAQDVEPAAALPEQPMDVFQALVASGMIPPTAAQPPARIDRKPAPEAMPFDEPAAPLPYEDTPEQPVDVFQALMASGMIPPPRGQRKPDIARKQETAAPRSPSAPPSPDRLPVQYAAPPHQVMRAGTDEEVPESPESSGENGGAKNTDIEKLAQDVYKTLRNRLRVEQERRGRG